MQSLRTVFSANSKLLAIASCWAMCLLICDTIVVAQQYPGIKCVVHGDRQCRIEHSAEFNWDLKSKDKECHGKIFFASRNAVDQFQVRVVDKLRLDQQPNTSLLLKANHQLALTGQVKQQLCPVTGKSIDQEHQLLVAGVNVCFHDAAARGKIESLGSTWQRATRVFAGPVFAKSFSKSVEHVKQTGVAVADELVNSVASKGESTVLPKKR